MELVCIFAFYYIFKYGHEIYGSLRLSNLMGAWHTLTSVNQTCVYVNVGVLIIPHVINLTLTAFMKNHPKFKLHKNTYCIFYPAGPGSQEIEITKIWIEKKMNET